MKTSFKAVAVTSLCALFACGGSSTSQQAPDGSLANHENQKTAP